MPDQAHPNTEDEAAGPMDLAQAERVEPSYHFITVRPERKSPIVDANSIDPEEWYLGPKVDHQLRLRRNDHINYVGQMLERYFHLLEIALKTLTSMFSRDEVGLMLDAHCGTLCGGAVAMLMLPWQIEDAVTLDHLDLKWGVDGKALIAKVHALDYTSRAALVDAIERWWNWDLDMENPEIEDCLTMS